MENTRYKKNSYYYPFALTKGLMLELSAFLRLRWPIYGTTPEIKKKKEKRITKHGRHYSSYRKKKTIIE